MALFGFEKDVHNILKLDMPVTNAPVARWQRKTSTSTSAATSTGSLSPGKSGNLSRSTSKTPNKTPGRNTPNKVGGDRYIPARNSKQMEVASFLLSKENESPQMNQKAWSMALNGFDVEEAKVLHFRGKSLNAPEGYQNTPTPASSKKSRYISSVPDRVFAHFIDLDLIDWGKQNLLAVALNHTVYIWDASTLVLDCKVQLWDVEHQKLLRSMTSHTARVGSLSWNDHILSSGARSGHIHHHDVRVAEHHISTLRGHTQEVCGLKWSPDGKYLASGGNDSMVYVWSGIQEGSAQTALHSFNDHQGAVKALAWCPWQPNILASGGGTSDRHIRIYLISVISVSSHGFSDNLTIWKYPSLTKVADLFGHEGRVLNMALSPNGATIASVAADETVRQWKICSIYLKTKIKFPVQTSCLLIL
uniref:Anaphase-promoting complex subunit 4 WD40 domain-containing protein n=1 Tax=Denticeps clupeoides TaxID=299321 RepID=A0AAY4AMU4_9TELE